MTAGCSGSAGAASLKNALDNRAEVRDDGNDDVLSPHAGLVVARAPAHRSVIRSYDDAPELVISVYGPRDGHR